MFFFSFSFFSGKGCKLFEMNVKSSGFLIIIYLHFVLHLNNDTSGLQNAVNNLIMIKKSDYKVCHISHYLIGRAMREQVTCFLEQRMASVRKKKSKAGETGRMRRHKIERE